MNIIDIGHLGKDPNSQGVTSFSAAVSAAGVGGGRV